MAVTASGLELTWARPVILARGRHRLYRCTCEIMFHHSVPPCRTEGSGGVKATLQVGCFNESGFR